MKTPIEFTKEYVEENSPRDQHIYSDFLKSGEPFRSIFENNPWLIPRNHNIESSINSAVNGDMKLLNNLISSSTHSYDYNKVDLELMTPPKEDYDQNYKTYCGT